MKASRLVAFEVLSRVIKNDAFSNIALDKALDGLEGKDKAFCASLVYGVIERRLTLDYLISPHLKSKPKPKVMLLLYIGAYQLCFMDKVPDSAAVNETVRLADSVGCAYYKGMVNAVLRKISDSRIDIASIDNRSVKYSCPEHLIRMWDKMYSKEAVDAFLPCINEKQPLFAVPNTLFVDADELQYELFDEGIKSEVEGELVKITSSFDISKSKAFERGLFHIEDKSSFECAKALGAKRGDTVLDVCAAPGGKSFTLAERMNGGGAVYSFDLYEHRVKLISDGAKRLGLENIIAKVNDAEVYNERLPAADKVLCDVPCSGFGIIRRKPEIRYKELDSIKALPELQYKILCTSARYLKKEGTLVYSTCTLNKRENEAVAQRFLEENNNFKLRDMKTVFPSFDGGDGFFFAVMEKIND